MRNQNYRPLRLEPSKVSTAASGGGDCVHLLIRNKVLDKVYQLMTSACTGAHPNFCSSILLQMRGDHICTCTSSYDTFSLTNDSDD